MTMRQRLIVALVMIAIIVGIAVLAADSFDKDPLSVPADSRSAGFFISKTAEYISTQRF